MLEACTMIKEIKYLHNIQQTLSLFTKGGVIRQLARLPVTKIQLLENARGTKLPCHRLTIV